MHPQPLRITLPLKTLASTTLSSYTPIHNIFGVKKKKKKTLPESHQGVWIF